MLNQPKEGKNVRPPWLRELRDEIRSLREEVRVLARKPEEPDPLLDTDQVAERLSVSERTVRNLAELGDLPKIKVRGAVRYHRDAVEAYIRRQAGEGAA